MFHILEPVNDWLEAVKILPPDAFVKATSPQWLSEAIATNPNLFTMQRYINDDIQDVNPDDTDEIRANRARDWFERFIDGTFLYGETAEVPHCLAVKSVGWWNEYYADSQGDAERDLFLRQEKIAAQVWMNEYRNGPHADRLGHIRLATCATAVGNNIPLESAKIASRFDCILDYHGYDNYLARDVRDPLSWEYHCGRWNTMDAMFRDYGYFVDWLLGESGPYATVYDGWRSKMVLDRDVDGYVAAVRRFIMEISGTDAYKTGRMLGFSLFTTGGNWPLYATNTYEMKKIAEVVRDTWKPGTEPEPPVESELIAHLRRVSIEAQVKHGIWLNPAAGLQQVIVNDGAGHTWWAVHKEAVTEFEGRQYTIQAAEHTLTGERRVYVWQEGKPIWWFS